MFLGFFYQLIDVPAVIVLAFWFVLQLIDGIATIGATEMGGGIAFFAHIGGFVFGAVVAGIIRWWSGRSRGGRMTAGEPAEPAAVG